MQRRVAPEQDGPMEPPRSAQISEDLKSVAIASILEVTSDFLYVEDTDKLLEKIAKTVSETFGLRTVHIGILDPETGLYVVRAAYGFEPEQEAKVRKVRYTQERMGKDLRPEFKIGRNAYYVPADGYEFDNEDMPFIIHPERMDRARRFPDEWHELDYVDFMMFKKDGTVLGYLEIDEPDDHKVPSDETLGAIGVFSDLAAIAIQNAELYDELERDRKKVELLIDLIGHDVNNYAQAVSGFIELAMARRGVPEPSRKSLAKALDQVWNLNKLVTNVKLYARVESAGAKGLVPTDLKTVITEAFEAAQTYNPSKSVNLVFEDDGVRKLADMNELGKEIFVNLFSNAIKFDTHENVVVEVDITNTCEDKREMWCATVADHGPCIPDEIKDRIFERFTQGGSLSHGSGLGLHIARALVAQYKGRIWVEDRVKGDHSQGSVFKVLLPKSSEKNQVG